MNKATVLAAVFLAAHFTSATGARAQAPASAQAYPSKPLRIIVPLLPGGNLDIVTRAIAAPMGETFGQQIIVENRPGASSLVGTQFVAKAPADGYTLLAIANTFASVPSLMRNVGYEALKDFTAYIKTEFDKKARLARDAGIRIE
jgi:tripartite-type tricarboxylate transporter receptor subunit TctC